MDDSHRGCVENHPIHGAVTTGGAADDSAFTVGGCANRRNWSLAAFLACQAAVAGPTLLIAAMFRALDAFRIFDLVYVLTGGGPADSTEVLSTLTYKNLFSALQFDYGSALSTAMFVTEILIALGFGIFLLQKLKAIGQ